MDDSDKNMEVERLRLIDVSSEDDCLISSPSGFLGNQIEHEYFELSEVGNEQEREDAVNLVREKDEGPVLSSEPERTRNMGKCNLRKSLAWDSAFFTSAGVLEPEELSFLNCGLKKADIHPLPGIQEDLRRSTESNSTLNSDNLTLETLEVDLFEDIRASIQRSSKESNMTYSSRKARPGESAWRSSGAQSIQSSRKMETASRNRMKPVVASKRQTINTQGPEKTKKEATVRPHAVQAATRSGEPKTSLLKPPKVVSRVNSVTTSPTKRTSLGANRVKIENNNAKSATGRRETVVVSKRPILGDASVIPRSTPSPKSSTSSSTSAKMESAASCSSNNRSGGTSSESTGKSPSNFLKNKTTSRIVNLPIASTLKSPLKISPRNKTESGNSRLSAYLMSVSKLSSSISPASSVDGWSSESSSSTSTVNQHSNSSKTGLDFSSPRKGFYLERDASQSYLQRYPHEQRPCVEHKRTGLPSPCAKKTFAVAGAVSRPASTDISKSFKPSGLRMPSPKIGFFDAEKSTVRTSNGSLQCNPGVRSAIPRHGAGVGSLNGGTIKAKPSKIQPTKSVTGRSSINCDSHVAGVPHSASSTRSTCFAQPQELSNASAKLSATKTTRENCPGITSKHQNDVYHGTGEERCLNTGEVGELTNTDRNSLGSFLNERANGGQEAFENDMVTVSKKPLYITPIKRTTTEEDIPQICCKPSSDCNYDSIDPSSESGDKIMLGQGYVESNLHSCHGSNEKENALCCGNQVDGLSRHIEAIDLNMEQFIGKKGFSPSQFDNNTDNPSNLKLALSNSKEVPVHGQEDFPMILSKAIPHSLSPNTADTIPSIRTPLAVRLSFCNGTGSFELASESTTEKLSTFSFTERVQTDNS